MHMMINSAYGTCVDYRVLPPEENLFITTIL